MRALILIAILLLCAGCEAITGVTIPPGTVCRTDPRGVIDTVGWVRAEDGTKVTPITTCHIRA